METGCVRGWVAASDRPCLFLASLVTDFVFASLAALRVYVCVSRCEFGSKEPRSVFIIHYSLGLHVGRLAYRLDISKRLQDRLVVM